MAFILRMCDEACPLERRRRSCRHDLQLLGPPKPEALSPPRSSGNIGGTKISNSTAGLPNQFHNVPGLRSSLAWIDGKHCARRRLAAGEAIPVYTSGNPVIVPLGRCVINAVDTHRKRYMSALLRTRRQ